MAESGVQNAIDDFESRIPGGGSTYFYKRRDTKQPDGSMRKQVWCLGAGGMAATFDGVKNDGGTRRPVAIKQVALEKAAAERLEAYEFRGLSALSGRDHPNIVKFITFFKGDDGDGRVRLSFVFERCPTVVPYLVEAVTNSKSFVVPSDDLVQPERDGCDLAVNPIRKPPLTLREGLHVTRQLLSAVAYLHSAMPPIIHRDMKPDNTLIWGARTDPSTGEVLLDVKVTDYGTVRRVDKRDMTMGQGTRAFMAPEVEVQTGSDSSRSGGGGGGGGGGTTSVNASSAPRPTAQYDASVDVFSVGATFFYLLSSQPPHSNTQVPWLSRFGGDTGVEVKTMDKWAARREAKRAQAREKCAVGTAASEAGRGGSALPAAALPLDDSSAAVRAVLTPPEGGAGGGGGGAPTPAAAPALPPLPKIELVAPSSDASWVVIGGAGGRGAGGGAGSRPPSAGPPPAAAASAPPATANGGAQGMTTILDFVFPPGSRERVFLEGLIVAAPGVRTGEGKPRRWTAQEALAHLDETWPEIKAGGVGGAGGSG